MGIFGGPEAPQTPPPEPVQRNVDDEVKTKRDRRLRLAALQQGRQSTVRTSAQGVDQSAGRVGVSTALGGA